MKKRKQKAKVRKRPHGPAHSSVLKRHRTRQRRPDRASAEKPSIRRSAGLRNKKRRANESAEGSPKDYVLGLADKGKIERHSPLHPALQSILVRKSRIAFYPASGFDGSPLQRFHDLCDTFIYCDWACPQDRFISWLEELRTAFTVSGCQPIDQ